MKKKWDGWIEWWRTWQGAGRTKRECKIPKRVRVSSLVEILSLSLSLVSGFIRKYRHIRLGTSSVYILCRKRDGKQLGVVARKRWAVIVPLTLYTYTSPSSFISFSLAYSLYLFLSFRGLSEHAHIHSISQQQPPNFANISIHCDAHFARLLFSCVCVALPRLHILLYIFHYVWA